MADIVTFPCEYMVLSSGYEDRLIDQDHIGALEQITIPREMTPLGIISTEVGNFRPLLIRNGAIDLYARATTEEAVTVYVLLQRLGRNKLLRTGIILRIGTFKNVMDIIPKFKDINYCTMYGTPDIKFLKNEKNIIDLAFVTMDAELG